MDPRHGRRSGFTLVELLVVIAIIGIVVVIVFPALAGARNAARKAATQALISNLGKASEQFMLENKRAPGYFPAKDMADAQNMQRGFSAMENIMLELAGGITADPRKAGDNQPCNVDPNSGPQVVNVGPKTDRTVRVNLFLIGAKNQSKAPYFTPDNRFYVRQCGEDQQVAGAIGSEPGMDHRALPDMVDAWGQPLLAWVQEDIVAGANTAFALEQWDTGNNGTRARYYWAPNAAFLNSTALGRMGKPQARPTGSTNADDQSLLGSQWNWATRAKTLAGLLGNAAYPEPSSPANDPIPSRGRAGIVFHSAGGDGIFLNRKDMAGKRAASVNPNSPFVQYNPPQAAPNPNEPLPKPTDPLDGFDDLIGTTGN